MKVAVTGASGKAAVVRGLLERDHDVLGVISSRPKSSFRPSCAST
jgi:nucleoside-diphosphate-sugar epimerase